MKRATQTGRWKGDETMRALIVDDSRFIREYLAGLLRGLGVETEQAIDGFAGWERLRPEGAEWLFNFALVDMNMPRMGGLDLVRKLRAEQRYGGVKLMMVTTEADMVFVTAALQFGADEFLMKPFSPESLTEKLRLLGVLES